MSNSRIFCIGFVTWLTLEMMAKLLGFDGKYVGISAQIVRMTIGFAWGAWAVALWGDRTTSKGSSDE